MAQEDKREADLASAIYGTILVTAVVVGTSADSHITAGWGALIVFITTFVFWLAHVYANLLAFRAAERRMPSGAEVRRIALDEWPIIQAGFFPIAVLRLAGAGLFSRSIAFSIAMWMGVAALFIWGLIVAHREGQGMVATLLTAGITAAFGVAIVLLKVIIE
jgi:hypothetical protein